MRRWIFWLFSWLCLLILLLFVEFKYILLSCLLYLLEIILGKIKHAMGDSYGLRLYWTIQQVRELGLSCAKLSQALDNYLLFWTSCECDMDMSWKRMNKPWSSHDQVMNRSWTRQEQVMNKSRILSHELVIMNWTTSHKQIMNKLWQFKYKLRLLSHEQAMIKQWSNHVQVMKKA